jgi:hypothetical protein
MPSCVRRTILSCSWEKLYVASSDLLRKELPYLFILLRWSSVSLPSLRMWTLAKNLDTWKKYIFITINHSEFSVDTFKMHMIIPPLLKGKMEIKIMCCNNVLVFNFQ